MRPGADGVHRWRRISRPPAPRYNLAPSSPLLAVRVHPDGKRVITRLHWGLIPSWAKDRKIGYRTINARAETVAEKPAFRAAFKQRRRLIPADSRICINFIKTHA
ncbi:SOS response-associated peptidase family protein [uncultured Thiocystis sp.]|uniref:SOS response-associated peptidase n=1 Tax=uncultured Thiocystis sp. TaxID=1202134 RepID=UPI00341251A3